MGCINPCFSSIVKSNIKMKAKSLILAVLFFCLLGCSMQHDSVTEVVENKDLNSVLDPNILRSSHLERVSSFFTADEVAKGVLSMVSDPKVVVKDIYPIENLDGIEVWYKCSNGKEGNFYILKNVNLRYISPVFMAEEVVGDEMIYVINTTSVAISRASKNSSEISPNALYLKCRNRTECEPCAVQTGPVKITKENQEELVTRCESCVGCDLMIIHR